MPDVADVHDLHVWSLSSEIHAMSAHVACLGHPTLEQAQATGERIKAVVAERFSIGHATIEMECEACPEPDPCTLELDRGRARHAPATSKPRRPNGRPICLGAVATRSRAQGSRCAGDAVELLESASLCVERETMGSHSYAGPRHARAWRPACQADGSERRAPHGSRGRAGRRADRRRIAARGRRAP